MSSRPTTILLILEHFRPGAGAENAAIGLCRGLSERGYAVHVAAGTHDTMDGITCHDATDLPGLRERLAPDLVLDWNFRDEADIHRMGGGAQAAFDGYNLESYRGLGRAFKSLSLALRPKKETIDRQHRMLTRPGARFVCNSQFCADQAIAAGANPDMVTVIHNGVDLARFGAESLAAKRAAARSELGLADGQVAGLFVAHNLRLKNIDLLLRVGAKLAARHPEWRLIVAGKRRPKKTPPWLIYAGALRDMTTAYSAADILLHPTYFDSFANVILEGLAAGLPAVVSDRSGVCEIMTHGTDGYVLPVVGASTEIEEEWLRHVAGLVTEPAVRARIGGAARATAGAYGMPGYVDRWETMLTDTLRSREATP